MQNNDPVLSFNEEVAETYAGRAQRTRHCDTRCRAISEETLGELEPGTGHIHQR